MWLWCAQPPPLQLQLPVPSPVKPHEAQTFLPVEMRGESRRARTRMPGAAAKPPLGSQSKQTPLSTGCSHPGPGPPSLSRWNAGITIHITAVGRRISHRWPSASAKPAWIESPLLVTRPRGGAQQKTKTGPGMRRATPSPPTCARVRAAPRPRHGAAA